MRVVPPPSAPAREAASRLAIVLVHYETPEFLRACLASLAAAPPRVTCDIVVVDNSRHGDAAAAVVTQFPSVRLTRPGRNAGFAGGVNHGFSVTDSPYVLVLNPDIVAQPGAVDALVAFMDAHPDVGLAGAQLRNPDGTLQYSCRTFYTLPAILLRRTPLGRLFPRARAVRDHLMLDWDHATPRDVDWVLGAAMIVRRSAVHEVGPADERFFLYFEDVDWCYRMHQAGWRVAYVPDAVMVHHHQRDSARGLRSRGLRIHLSSTLKFYEKWSLVLYVVKKNADAVRGVGLVLADALAVVLAFFVAYAARSLGARVFVKPLFPLASYGSFLVIVAAVTMLVFGAQGLYARWRDSFGELLWRTVRAATTSGILLMAATFVLSVKFSRVMLLTFVPVLAVFTALSRSALAAMVRRVADGGIDVRRVLLVGTPAQTAPLADALQAARGDGHALAGQIDPAGARFANATPQQVLRQLLHAVREGRVGDVVLAEPYPAEPLRSLLVASLTDAGVAVHVAPRARDLIAAGSAVEEIAGVPLIAVRRRRRARAPLGSLTAGEGTAPRRAAPGGESEDES